MRIRHFYYFLAIVKEMSFTRAAQRLHISQQALSVYIQNLEEQYGVTLFERKPALRLTLAGEQLAFYAERILQEERHMNASLADIAENRKAKLAVGSTRSISNLSIPLIWEQYHQLQPHITLSLVEAMTADLDELLEENKIDLYIGINAPTRANTCRVVLAKESFYCVISPTLLCAKMPENWHCFLSNCHDGVDLLQIQDFPFIVPFQGILRSSVEAIFASISITPNFVFETSNHDLIFQLSKSGSGVGLLSRMLLYRLLQQKTNEDNFYVIPIKNELTPYFIELVHKTDTQHHFIDVFIDITKKVFSELDDSAFVLTSQA